MAGELERIVTVTENYLHQRFNPRDDHISPVRIKGFRREHLAQLFAELGFKTGAEVGVAEGIYSRVLCETIPDLRLYAVDLWAPYKRGFSDARIKNQEMQDEALALAHEKLDKYNVAFIQKPSLQASFEISDESLDFVYIDGDHAFDYAMMDIILWSYKIKPGGIVSGHDAYRFRGAGVVDAVSAYTHCHKIHEFYLCDEREISWFWVRP